MTGYVHIVCGDLMDRRDGVLWCDNRKCRRAVCETFEIGEYEPRSETGQHWRPIVGEIPVSR